MKMPSVKWTTTDMTQILIQYFLFKSNQIQRTMPSEKVPSKNCKMHRFRSSCASAKYHPHLCSPFIHSEVSNDSVRRQWRCCPHMPKITFSYRVAQIGMKSIFTAPQRNLPYDIFTTIWATSAGDKLMIFFFYFAEKWIWQFMQTAVCMNSQTLFSGLPHARLPRHHYSKGPIFEKSVQKIHVFENVVCWNVYMPS